MPPLLLLLLPMGLWEARQHCCCDEPAPYEVMVVVVVVVGAGAVVVPHRRDGYWRLHREGVGD
jgi:hypothetical protein